MIHYKTRQSKSGLKHPLVLSAVQECGMYSASFVAVSPVYLNVLRKTRRCMRSLLENISMQRHRVSFVALPLWRTIKHREAKRLFVSFAEYFKALAYCSCSQTVALKVPVAASSFSSFPFRGEAQVA